MFKIFTVLGTRPEIIKLSRIINIFDKNFNHKIIHTGQNFDFELNQIFFKELQIREPDLYLNCAKKTSIETISEILVKFEKLILKNKKMICKFVSNENNPFYNSEKFQSLLKSINTNHEICELKEKKSNRGDRLLLVFKDVCTVQDGIDCLKIL